MKKIKKTNLLLLILILCLTMSGCVTTTHKAFRTDESQVELRSIQTRAFDMTDKKKMMQTVISTMQDLDFVIDKADVILGSVTGTKFFKAAHITMSVTVRPRGKSQLLVRINAQHGINAVKDAETYQDFFTILGKSLFLTAHEVD